MFTACLTSSLLVVDKCVQCGRSDRGPALRPTVGRGGQSAAQERGLRFGGAYEADGKPYDQRRSNVELEQLEERGRRVPDDPDDSPCDLFRSEPEASRRARYAEPCGEFAGAWVRDEAPRPVACDPARHHALFRYYTCDAAQLQDTIYQVRFDDTKAGDIR